MNARGAAGRGRRLVLALVAGLAGAGGLAACPSCPAAMDPAEAGRWIPGYYASATLFMTMGIGLVTAIVRATVAAMGGPDPRAEGTEPG